MNMNKITCLFLALIGVISLYSCSSDEAFTPVNLNSLENESVSRSAVLNDVIIPFEGDRDTLRRPLETRASFDIRQEIDQLEEIPFYLQVQGNSNSNQFLNATNAGEELTVATFNENIGQQFYIKILPATSGIPYLIYSNKTKTPLKIGAYSSAPDVKVLYAANSNSESSFGASWDFRKAEYSLNSFVIENQDFPAQGSSGSWMDIYYPVITVDGAKISFSKYNKSPRQEFAIIPAEDFEVESIRYNINASSVLEQKPDIVFVDRYTNNGPIEQSHKFTITESYKESSSFNRKTSYNVNVATTVKTRVPFIAEGQITTSVTSGQDFTYGESEEHTTTINREYPVNVPPYHTAKLSLTLFNYNMDVEYVATCRGLVSGKKIDIKGRWVGVDVVETDAVADFTPLNGGKKTRIVITKEMLKSKMPIGIK